MVNAASTSRSPAPPPIPGATRSASRRARATRTASGRALRACRSRPSAKDGFARVLPAAPRRDRRSVRRSGGPARRRDAARADSASPPARSACAAPIASHACGDAASCAAFGADALPRCLARCDDALACDADPLRLRTARRVRRLGLHHPGRRRPLRARRCTIDDDCAPPLGRCDLDSGGFCVAAS